MLARRGTHLCKAAHQVLGGTAILPSCVPRPTPLSPLATPHSVLECAVKGHEHQISVIEDAGGVNWGGDAAPSSAVPAGGSFAGAACGSANTPGASGGAGASGGGGDDSSCEGSGGGDEAECAGRDASGSLALCSAPGACSADAQRRCIEHIKHMRADDFKEHCEWLWVFITLRLPSNRHGWFGCLRSFIVAWARSFDTA